MQVEHNELDDPSAKPGEWRADSVLQARRFHAEPAARLGRISRRRGVAENTIRERSYSVKAVVVQHKEVLIRLDEARASLSRSTTG